MTAGPPRGQHTGHSVQHGHDEAGVIGDGGQPGCLGCSAGLDERVFRECRTGLRNVLHIVESDQLDAEQRLEDPTELFDLALVTTRQDDAEAHNAAESSWCGARSCCSSASCCRWVSSAQPATARSSSWSSSGRSKGWPSAVPCTSTNSPVPVQTTFMSVSARTSSAYSRSSRGWPSTMPTLTAATDPRRGSPASAPLARSQLTASASAT